MNKMKNGHARLPALAAAACGAACALLFLFGDGQDEGMGEWFDLFLGGSAETWASGADPDADGIDNLAEYILLTDPLNPDTDMDGWPDDIDANPLSRAVYLWGEPRFTRGQTNLYSRPPWAGHGLAMGGLPLFGGAYGYAWTLFSQEDALLMPLDRAAFSNDLWLAAVASGGALSAGILDSNLVELAGPFPLAAASGPWLTNRLPLSAFAGAGAVSRRRFRRVFFPGLARVYRLRTERGLRRRASARPAGLDRNRRGLRQRGRPFRGPAAPGASGSSRKRPDPDARGLQRAAPRHDQPGCLALDAGEDHPRRLRL